MSLIIGIDPGKKGGIVVLHDGDVIAAYPMPMVTYDFYVTSKKKYIERSKVDCMGVYDILSQYEADDIWIEDLVNVDVGGGWNAFNMGRGVGRIEGALESQGLEFNYVRPNIWTKVIWSQKDIVWKHYEKDGKKKRKKDTKATSLNSYRRLFPGQDDFLLPPRKRIPHDGIVDAALIAFYGEVYGHSLTNN